MPSHLNALIISWFYEAPPSEICNGLRLVSWPSALWFARFAPSARLYVTPPSSATCAPVVLLYWVLGVKRALAWFKMLSVSTPWNMLHMMTLVSVCWFTLHDLALIMSKSLRQIVREKICLLRDLTLLLVWVLTCVTLWNTICRRGRDVRDSSYWKVE